MTMLGFAPFCRLGYEQSHLKKVVDVGLLSRTLPPLMNVPPRSHIGGLEHCDPFLHWLPSLLLLASEAASGGRSSRSWIGGFFSRRELEQHREQHGGPCRAGLKTSSSRPRNAAKKT